MTCKVGVLIESIPQDCLSIHIEPLHTVFILGLHQVNLTVDSPAVQMKKEGPGRTLVLCCLVSLSPIIFKKKQTTNCGLFFFEKDG